ncbi:hypothetical protein SAMN05877753_102548 [Bacillus oleivorans]|uniref:Uncharacterized protein n=1 Tax=Bacillus oleivorans TaxID=1448271 RepID=A0A285CLQ3_9BACI|nr:hypothetical protein [Bacillus oleivorans]SNX68471.1 hypothetical protein SAMN05877753_102548 [Bacillus oleivorans]
MVQKNMKQYKVVRGPYKDKAQGLKFGYEYTSGNKVTSGKKNTQVEDSE